MPYEGYEVPIAIGSLGLQTDGPQSQLPPNAAITANNVSFFTGVVSKSPGTSLYNSTGPLANAIVAGFDWWPTPLAASQTMIAITSEGKVWLDTGNGSFSTLTPLLINETQLLTFSSVPTAGSITFRWNGNNASSGLSVTSATTAAALQTNLRTITGLGSVTVSGSVTVGTPDVLYGFTINFPSTSTSQPLITSSANSLTDVASAAVTLLVTHIQPGAAALGACTPDTHIVAGGAEVANNPRRLFLYSGGTSQMCMITGGASNVTGITRPAADWASSFPKFGLIFSSYHVAMGNGSSPHTVYFSRLGDHTDFSTSETDGTAGAFFPVFPGEGDGLIGACVFKGALLLFKRPFGLYMLQYSGQGLNTAGAVQITKISDSFALSSPHGLAQFLNDLYGGSSSGSLFSQSATNAFGSLEGGDLLMQAAVRNYFRQNFAYSGIPNQQAIYYPDKILGMFTGQDNSGDPQNRILMYDGAGQSARISVENKDQPTCMFLRKDTNFVPRPYYGANDGNVYVMDQSAANVNGAAYLGEFQTPYIDFSYLDPKLSEKVKLFDFLAVTYQSVGNWPFYVDVYVDGAFAQTVTFNMQASTSTLDNFVLDVDRLGGANVPLTTRQPLKSCSGKTISLRVYNGNLNQTFTIERFIISFRESGEQARSSKS